MDSRIMNRQQRGVLKALEKSPRGSAVTQMKFLASRTKIPKSRISTILLQAKSEGIVKVENGVWVPSEKQ